MATELGLSILSFAGMRLAFPLTETVSIRRSSELVENHAMPLACGSVVHAERRWPVFRLNANFEPLLGSLQQNSYCVCLSADDGQTGLVLACDATNLFKWTTEDMLPIPLPTCMQREVTPIQQLIQQGTQLLPVSSAPVLAAYLRSLMNSPMEKNNE